MQPAQLHLNQEDANIQFDKTYVKIKTRNTEAARAQAEGLRPITGDFLQKYCRHLPEKAGGPDGWSTQMLRGLTKEQYHQLASVFNRAHQQGVVPSQWGITSVTMLPKKPTVERPIGLMHVCAKAMLKSRWHLIEEWNHHFQQIAPWDKARVGVSAIEVGAARLLRTEIHGAHDLHGVTLFIDLSTFFESVDHTRLIQVAGEVGFPPHAQAVDAWLDDVSIDLVHESAGVAVQAAVQAFQTFKEAATTEGLTLSEDKTCFVCTTAAAHKLLQKINPKGGPKVELVAKDLGVDSHGGRRRRTGRQASGRKGCIVSGFPRSGTGCEPSEPV